MIADLFILAVCWIAFLLLMLAIACVYTAAERWIHRDPLGRLFGDEQQAEILLYPSGRRVTAMPIEAPTQLDIARRATRGEISDDRK